MVKLVQPIIVALKSKLDPFKVKFTVEVHPLTIASQTLQAVKSTRHRKKVVRPL